MLAKTDVQSDLKARLREAASALAAVGIDAGAMPPESALTAAQRGVVKSSPSVGEVAHNRRRPPPDRSSHGFASFASECS